MHTALTDCELLSKVYINLIDQRQLNFNETNDINLSKNVLIEGYSKNSQTI